MVQVDALVALQADEPRVRGGRQRLGHLGLAHAGLASSSSGCSSVAAR
jgi:hypothetical protein